MIFNNPDNNNVLLDLHTNQLDRPVDVQIRYVDPQVRFDRRGNSRLVSQQGMGYKAEITVEWIRLREGRSDALRDVLTANRVLRVTPDPTNAPNVHYFVRWTSPFEFVDSFPNNWDLGKSGTLIFEEI